MAPTVPVNPQSLQAMFTAWKGQGDRLTLHTADPGSDITASRAPGNVPVATTWPAGSNGTGTGSVCACAVTASDPANPVMVRFVALSHSSGQHVATYQIPGPGAGFSFNGTLNVTPTLTVVAG